MELADIRYLRKVLNCKNFSKVNFKNADILGKHFCELIHYRLKERQFIPR